MAIQFNVDAALAKLGELINQHGPQAVKMAEQIVQVNAVGSLVQGVLFLLFAAATGGGAFWLWRRVYKESLKSYGEVSDFVAMGGGITAFLLSAVTVFLFINGLANVLDVWVWVAVFNPQLGLGHEVLRRVAGIG